MAPLCLISAVCIPLHLLIITSNLFSGCLILSLVRLLITIAQFKGQKTPYMTVFRMLAGMTLFSVGKSLFMV